MSKNFLNSLYGELSFMTIPLDELHTRIAEKSEKLKLEVAFQKLLECILPFFYSDDEVRTKTAVDLKMGLAYIDYILNYLVFLNFNNTEMPTSAKHTLNLFEDEVLLIAKELNRLDKNAKRFVDERSGRILKNIKIFRKLIDVCKSKNGEKSLVSFPTFHQNLAMNQNLQYINSILLIPFSDVSSPLDRIMLMDFCEKLSNIRAMNPPIYILDLLLSVVLFYCERTKPYFAQDLKYCRATEYLMQFCVYTSLELIDLSESLDIYNVHRFNRLNEICTRTQMPIESYFYMVLDEHPVDFHKLPAFVEPPRKSKVPTRFWKYVIAQHDFNPKTFFSCAICQKASQNIENSAILDSCEHKFCLKCTESWFLLRNTCPMCSADVKIWTSWKLAKGYADYQNRLFCDCIHNISASLKTLGVSIGASIASRFAPEENTYL